MAKRKLDDKQKRSLRKTLAKKLKKAPTGPILGILRQIGDRFGVSAEAVRYYSRDLMRGRTRAPRGRPRKYPRPRGIRVVTLLRERAREHRKLASVLARKHERIARRYELHADRLASLEI